MTILGTEGYYQFLEAEIAYQRGDWDEVIELSGSSRTQLPLVEQLMRAELLALEGVARGRIGDPLGQIQHFEQVMEIDPSVFRRLDVELPVRMGGGSGVDGDVLKALSRSLDLMSVTMGCLCRLQVDKCVCWEVWGKSLRARSFQLEMTR